jgi:RNA:NAD 2'-phosphotransferase (TPT1/KptA family)
MYGYYTIREILKLAAKKGVKRSTFKPKKDVKKSLDKPRFYRKKMIIRLGVKKKKKMPWYIG